MNFNPRSGERSDQISGANAQMNIISIHAPANGATIGSEFAELLEVISIHAPANGATHLGMR